MRCVFKLPLNYCNLTSHIQLELTWNPVLSTLIVVAMILFKTTAEFLVEFMNTPEPTLIRESCGGKKIREHTYIAMFSLCNWWRLLRKSIPSHVQVNIVSYVRLCLFWQAQYSQGTASQVILSSHGIPQINGVKFKTVNAMHFCLLHNKKKKRDKFIFLIPDQRCWTVKESRSVGRFLHISPLRNGATSQ